jgi:hypothetical protein
MTSRRAEAAGHSGIPVLHGSGKVHEEEQRDVDRYAETVVGVANDAFTQTYVIRPNLDLARNRSLME